jgi:hypothetical protein
VLQGHRSKLDKLNFRNSSQSNLLGGQTGEIRGDKFQVFHDVRSFRRKMEEGAASFFRVERAFVSKVGNCLSTLRNIPEEFNLRLLQHRKRTPWKAVLEKLTDPQVVKKLAAFCVIRLIS